MTRYYPINLQHRKCVARIIWHSLATNPIYGSRPQASYKRSLPARDRTSELGPPGLRGLFGGKYFFLYTL